MAATGPQRAVSARSLNPVASSDLDGFPKNRLPVSVAPALIPRKAAERIKTDRRDARKLAELFRLGLPNEVLVPPPDPRGRPIRVREVYGRGDPVLNGLARIIGSTVSSTSSRAS